jgi:hypothetical protein
MDDDLDDGDVGVLVWGRSSQFTSGLTSLGSHRQASCQASRVTG